MVTPANAPAGWYPDPGDRNCMRYWDGTEWLATPGVYPDPEDPRSNRRWTGTKWEGRRPRHNNLIVIGALVFLTLQGCATAISQAPTCNPHSPVSTPATTPIAVTAVLWLLGLAFAMGFYVVWLRHKWTPYWLPLVLIIGSVVLPLLSWVFAAASCGL
jgi:hypothetical protein